MSIIRELRRRNVFRVGIAYAISAWLLLQIVDVVVPIIEAPEWVSKAILLLIAVGFPLAVIFAWAFELTPEGLKFERDVDRTQSITSNTGRKLDFVIIAILGVAVVLFSLDKFLWSAVPAEDDSVTKRSIAVIPFVNMSDDPDQVFFSDGISEEILNTLVRAEGISVASRTSSFNYRNHEQNIPEIAEALDVLYVLEGSVRKAGDQLRITAQLIDAEQDRHLWSDTYDRGLADVFAVQSEIANAITHAIHSELGIASDTEIEVKALTQNMTAYDLYLRGTQIHRHRGFQQDILDSMALVEKAIEIDPEFAVAWESLAAIYNTAPYWAIKDRSHEEYIRLSIAAAERALELDPTLNFAKGILAASLAEIPPYDMVRSLALMEDALTADPKNTTLLNWHGMSLQAAGYFEEGLAQHERCLEVDPGYANCFYFVELGIFLTGRHDKAESYSNEYADFFVGEQFSSTRTAILVEYGNRSAAMLTLLDLPGMEAEPAYELVKALERPGLDNSAGYSKVRAWAEKTGFEIENHPDILVAFGDYDDDYDVLSVTADPWYWYPAYTPYRKSEQFRNSIRRMGIYTLWKARGFPPNCRPIGNDDFECD